MTTPIVTVFRSRLRSEGTVEGAPDGFDDASAATEELAHTMPGFVDFKTFVADDGERVSIVVFASREAHDAWRAHPVHRDAQRRGRDDWFEEYTIQVCELVHEHRFSRPE